LRGWDRRGRTRPWLIAGVAAAFALPAGAQAATITLDTGGDGSIGCTLRAAVDSAEDDADQQGCVGVGTYGSGTESTDTVVVPASIASPIQLAAGPMQVGGDGTLNIEGPGAAGLDVRPASGQGAFLVLGGPVTISGMTLSHANVSPTPLPGALGLGGVIQSDPNGLLTLDHVTVTGNTTAVTAASSTVNIAGGGISSQGGLTIRDSTIADNSVSLTLSAAASSDFPTAGGGGIYQATGGQLPLVIKRSTISGNTVALNAPGAGSDFTFGGGVYLDPRGGEIPDIEQSTISGNALTGTAQNFGGGIASRDVPSTLVGDTITDNTGAIANLDLSLINGEGDLEPLIQDTIVSNPQGGDNCSVHLPDDGGGFNLEDGNSCGFIQPSDQVNVASTGLDPNLADNGGPTLTHALLPGSPAIDAGSSFGATQDQRGLTRPLDLASVANATGGDGADIGAFELQGGQTLSVSSDGSGSGTVTSSPAGVDCGAACDVNFDDGTLVALTAAPAAGSSFAGWSGDCSGTGPCNVTMSAAHSVTATFDDTSPPSLRLRGKATQDIDKLAVKVASNEDAGLTGQASVALPRAAHAKGKVVKSKRVSASVTAGTPVKLRFKFAKKPLKLIERALATHEKLKARVVVNGTDAANNTGTGKKTVKLKDGRG
jgi:List-Bact-rpt repeat protein